MNKNKNIKSLRARSMEHKYIHMQSVATVNFTSLSLFVHYTITLAFASFAPLCETYEMTCIRILLPLALSHQSGGGKRRLALG